jgi:taurine dioxygenase
MSVEIRPLTNALGAEIRGVDLREPLAGPVVEAIHRAWLDRQVLVFRDQAITPEQQLAFTAHFGEFQLAYSPYRRGTKLNYIGNGIAPDGLPGSAADGVFDFHQDGVYRETPTKVTFLYALAIPAQGGNTKFASTYAAYAALPADLRARCETFDVLHTYYKSGGDPNAPKHIETHTHPLVIAHPETGRPLLLCDRCMSDSIVGLPRAESDALLERLCAAMERPENVYEHVWRLGDLVMWDNLATAHARTDFDSSERRMMQRSTVKGTKPVAYRSAPAVAR